MINPYSAYIATFALSIIAYGLGWSKLYPSLTSSLVLFISLTILVHICLSLFWRKKMVPANTPFNSYFDPILTTIFIYVLWIIDFIYEGGVPLFKIILHQPYNYRLFGAPSLHVFTVTFGSFYTVYLFSLFLAKKKNLYLFLYFINLFAALLIYSRAMLIFNVVASGFVFFLCSPSLSWKRLSFIGMAGVLLVYFFGILGTLRVSFEAKKNYDSELFLDIGQASSSFRSSGIPKEFFWGYIYLTSPIANLQQNINTFQVPSFSINRMFQQINNEILPDFISKRINRVSGIERELENDLPGTPFNVSTVYARSFSYLGWIGMTLTAVFVVVLPLAYMQWLPVNRYQLTGLAILNTMYLFLFYDNTIRFTGLSLQLAYPFVLPPVERAMAWIQKKVVL